MTPDEKITIGDRATQLLADDVFKRTIENLISDFTDKWRRSPPRDSEAREIIWRSLAGVDAVVSELQRLSDEGKHERSKVEAEAKRREVERKAKEEIAAKLGIRVEDIIDE